MPPHYVNCAHFCGGRREYEHATESLLMRFYHDHQVAHELSNRAASALQGAFMEDHGGNVEASLTHYGQAVTSLRDTVEQWSVVVSSSSALRAFLPGKLRPEFVESMTSLNVQELVRSLERSGNCPRGFAGPYEDVAKILSAGGEPAVIELFSVNNSKIQQLQSLSQEVLDVLEELRPVVARGQLWDTVVPHALLQTRTKHRLIDLDEKYFTALMDHAFFLEAISQMSRDVLIRSDIPYEECQSRRRQS